MLKNTRALMSDDRPKTPVLPSESNPRVISEEPNPDTTPDNDNKKKPSRENEDKDDTKG